MLNKKGLNRDIDFAAKTKKNSKKAILDKTKTSHQRLLESSKSDVFRFLDFWLLQGVFGFGGIWFISWRVDYFNFAIFLRTYFATFSLKKIKNMNPYNFQFFWLKKITIPEKKLKIICLKKYDKFHSHFFTWLWLTTLFHHLIEIPKVQQKIWV